MSKETPQAVTYSQYLNLNRCHIPKGTTEALTFSLKVYISTITWHGDTNEYSSLSSDWQFKQETSSSAHLLIINMSHSSKQDNVSSS